MTFPLKNGCGVQSLGDRSQKRKYFQHRLYPGLGLYKCIFVVHSPGMSWDRTHRQRREHRSHKWSTAGDLESESSSLPLRFPSGSATGHGKSIQEQFIQNLCETWEPKSHQHWDLHCRVPPQEGQKVLPSDGEGEVLWCHFGLFWAGLADCDFSGSGHRERVALAIAESQAYSGFTEPCVD